MSDKTYRSVIGAIQFDPKESEAAGKPVRNIVIKQVGFKEQAVSVYLTIWPGHAEVPLAKGDVIFAEGSYTQGKKDDKTYHNISVTRLAVLGKADEGKRVETTSDDEPEAGDDDIPF